MCTPQKWWVKSAAIVFIYHWGKEKNRLIFDVKQLLVTALTMIIKLSLRYEALFPLVLSGLMFVWIHMEQEALQHYGLSLKPKVTAPDTFIKLIISFIFFLQAQ